MALCDIDIPFILIARACVAKITNAINAKFETPEDIITGFYPDKWKEIAIFTNAFIFSCIQNYECNFVSYKYNRKKWSCPQT